MKNQSVVKMLPDGSKATVHPFHVTIEATDDLVLCRKDEDYDAYVKILAMVAIRKNVILVTYAVMSNHSHEVCLARSYFIAKEFGDEVKRMYSMYLQGKYGLRKVMIGLEVNVQVIDSVIYLRNALAYDTRNVIEIGENPDIYKWTAHRAMFRGGATLPGLRPLSSMNVREGQKIMHTNMDMKSSTLGVNQDNELEPYTFCDFEYFESAFNGDQSFYYKIVGLVNVSEMRYKLVEVQKKKLNDTDFIKTVDELSVRWFSKKITDITDQQKARLLPYVYHTTKTTPGQLARCLGLGTELVMRLLGK